jgi:hypothetical protein
MLREAKKMRKDLRASLENARTRVAELETQVPDSELEIDSLKASPIVSDEVDCADCSIFHADLSLFKEKHASKCEELDVLRVEVAELKSRSAKPNHLRNRLDRTLAPPVFSPQTNDFQKPIKLVSTSGKVFFGKESKKANEEKLVEKLSGEKPSEQPQPNPKPKLVRFHCGYCGRDGHKDEFSFKRKREERMAKEWANKDKYHPFDGVLEPRVQMPRAKASVRTVPAWRERKAVGGAGGRATPVRLVQAWTGGSLCFVLLQVRGLFLKVVVLVVGLESLQEVSLLGILPLELTTGIGGDVALRWRGGTVHEPSFLVLVLL